MTERRTGLARFVSLHEVVCLALRQIHWRVLAGLGPVLRVAEARLHRGVERHAGIDDAVETAAAFVDRTE